MSTAIMSVRASTAIRQERSLRVLLVGDYEPDRTLGSSKVYYELAAELRAAGVECEVLLRDRIGERPRNGRIRHAVAPLLAARAIRHTIREIGGCDVVDVASAESTIFGLFRNKQNGPVLVARTHGVEHLNYERLLADARAGLIRKPWTRRIWFPTVRLTQVELAARLADHMIVPDESARDYVLARGWKTPAALDVVPHGLSTALLEDPPIDLTRGRGILFCGAWDNMKGVRDLVGAFTLLLQRRPKTCLTVLGGGYDEATIRAAFPTVAQSQLTVAPRTDEAGVIAAYRCHDVLAFPSTFEGFGMVVIEALSQALPVVATPAGIARSIVRNGETGCLVPARDPAALAAALGHLLDAPDYARRLGNEGRRVATEFSWRRSARLTLDAYERALSARSAR